MQPGTAARSTGSAQITPGSAWDTPFTVANGLDWSPDGRTFYFTDSSAGAIYAYPFDPERGALGKRRIFARIEPGDGRPDGLTVDAEGCLWSALWDGWCIRRFDPQGRVMQDLRVPVPRPTSVTFGGPDLKTLLSPRPGPRACQNPGRSALFGRHSGCECWRCRTPGPSLRRVNHGDPGSALSRP